MRIKHISAKNFRNYPDLDLLVTSDMVILSGQNAVGKTNLLESVYFASVFKSFRDDSEYLFLRGTNSASLAMTFERGGETHTLEVYLEKRDRIYANFKLDGVKLKRKSAEGYVRVVIFEPTDVDLFTDSPDKRRRYMNMVLSQTGPEYIDALNQYKRILTQKTRLLTESRTRPVDPALLDPWNEQLAEYGAKIIWTRRQFVNFLNQHISEVYTGITQFHRSVEVVYDSIPGESEDMVRENLKLVLSEKKDREFGSGLCLVGPHRDDFGLQSDGLYLVPFSSRGEQRSQVLALKILELEYLNIDRDPPVLLLDDVLSELDESRRLFLLKYLSGKFQTFITTTHPLEMPGQHVTLAPSPQEAQV